MISVYEDKKLENWRDFVTTEMLDKWIDAFSYYRMKDRENTKVQYDKSLKVGTTLHFNRRVARTGYRLMVQDVPRDESDILCLKCVAGICDMPEADVSKVIESLDLFSPYKRIRYSVAGSVLSMLKERYGERFDYKDLGFRTLWYQDYNNKENFLSESPLSGTFQGVIHRQIGTYNPSSTWGGYDGEYDYESAYLIMKFTQPLYEVSLDWIPKGWDVGMQWKVLIHPSDVIEVRK